MSNAPPGLQKIFRDIQQASMHREEEAAKADPRKYKLSRTMKRGQLAYHYYPAGKDGRGRLVWFCWSCHRNVAGYFLGWRQVHGDKVTKRDRWLARKVRKRAEEIASRRSDAFRSRRQPPL